MNCLGSFLTTTITTTIIIIIIVTIIIIIIIIITRVFGWCSWLRHCATSRNVAGSILDGVIGIFH
jgi:hypothetical protein